MNISLSQAYQFIQKKAQRFQHGTHRTIPLLLTIVLIFFVWVFVDQENAKIDQELQQDSITLRGLIRQQFTQTQQQLSYLETPPTQEDVLKGPLHTRLKTLFSETPGLISIFWLDKNNKPISGFPDNNDIPSFYLNDTSLSLAQALGKPTYTSPVNLGRDTFGIALLLPYSAKGSSQEGLTVAIFSFEKLLTIPLTQTFFQRYQIEVLDDNRHTLTIHGTPQHTLSPHSVEIPLPIPGQGTSLRLQRYATEMHISLYLMAGLVLVILLGLVRNYFTSIRQLQRIQAQNQSLQNDVQRYLAQQNSLSTGLRTQTLDGSITSVNPAFCQLVGFSAHELTGLKPPYPFWPSEHIDELQHNIAQLDTTTGQGHSLEVSWRHKDGHTVNVSLHTAPLIVAGQTLGWISTVFDITRQRQEEEIFRQQEARMKDTNRFVSMVEMASTLAHELNQPLAAIASYATGCRNKLSLGNVNPVELTNILERISRQADRAADIVRRVRNLVRRSDPKRESHHINELVRDAINLLEPDARQRNIRFELELGDIIPALEVDRVMIEQLLINLIRNGMDAMRDVAESLRVIRIRTEMKDQEMLLSVIDRGHGIPPEVAEKLFSPFFTTKKDGMGVGLNICRSIAELHGGQLRFEPNPEGGTIFIFALKTQWQVR